MNVVSCPVQICTHLNITHYLTTNDAIIESNVTLTEITECFFAMNLHLLAREIISTIFDCAEYVHIVHLDVHLIRL